jgi:hypothetical protein
VDLDLATGISSSKLTGALPALDGSSLTGVGVTGIVSSANATAITIDSSERVALGSSTLSWAHFGAQASTDGAWSGRFENTHTNGEGLLAITASTASGVNVLEGRNGNGMVFSVRADGRGLSQFTAKAWCNFNQTGTQAIRDSHNISSISDQGTGWTHINFSNNLGNSDYCPFVTAHQGHASQDGNGIKYYGFDMNQTKNTAGYRVVIGNQGANSHSGSNKNQYDEPNAVTMVFGD